MKMVDINVDIGEGFPFDEDLLDFATSANVCCGRHAGSWELTKQTVFLCRQKGVRIGMHPGFPDRPNMGRIRMREDEVAQFANSVLEQAVEFMNYAPDTGYVKPHGAWYNMLTDPVPADPSLYRAAELMLDGVMAACKSPAMLLAGAPICPRLADRGEDVIAEGFADRAYEPDGSLRSRALPDAVLTDPLVIEQQVVRLARKVDSICVHGDTPDCLELVELVYRTLEKHGFEVGYLAFRFCALQRAARCRTAAVSATASSACRTERRLRYGICAFGQCVGR